MAQLKDTIITGNLAVSGTANITGNISASQMTVGSDPTANLQVATKQYVDNSITPATFKITISLNMSTGVYTADKTWAEITSAVSDGMLVYAVYSSDQYALSYFLNSGIYSATFSKLGVAVAVPPLTNQDQVSGDQFVVSHSSSTDTWTRTQVTLKDAYPHTATVSVPYQLWGSNTDLPITVTGMTSSATVWVSPNPSSATNIDNYNNAKLYCSAQSTDYLTFTYAGTKPTADISVNVVWIK